MPFVFFVVEPLSGKPVRRFRYDPAKSCAGGTPAFPGGTTLRVNFVFDLPGTELPGWEVVA